jgi:uncharacterized protein (DUF58 family)
MLTFVRFWWAGIRRWLRDPRIVWQRAGKARRITIEIQQWLPLPIILGLLAWYVADPSSIALMSLVTMTGIVLSDYVWALNMAHKVTGQRRLRFTAMQVGDEMEEEIILHNESSLPVLWAEFVDRSNIPGYTVSSVRGADSQKSVQWRAHTVCTRRGIFHLGPWELSLGQPFGLFVVRQVYLQRQEILVYPPMAALPEQILPHRGVMGDHRPLNQPLVAETIASHSVRSYQPGDPLRHIHWPTTARRTDPYVKLFAPEAASNIWLVPDFYSPDHLNQEENSSEELMVTVVASLAAALLEQRLKVGLFASTSSDHVVLPRQGQPYLWSILQVLAPLRSAPDYPLEDVLARVRVLMTGSDLLMVVTPSLRPDWIMPLQRLARGRGGGGRAEVILLDPASFDPSTQGAGFLSLLLERGIPAHLLRKEEVQLISGYYGELSRWEFTVSATGRAMARNAPRAAAADAPGSSQDARFWQGMSR